MVWVKTKLNLKYTAESPACEVCGYVFGDGEECWRRVKSGSVARVRRLGNPAVVGFDPTIYRCQKCYETMWH